MAIDTLSKRFRSMSTPLAVASSPENSVAALRQIGSAYQKYPFQNSKAVQRHGVVSNGHLFHLLFN